MITKKYRELRSRYNVLLAEHMQSGFGQPKRWSSEDRMLAIRLIEAMEVELNCIDFNYEAK